MKQPSTIHVILQLGILCICLGLPGCRTGMQPQSARGVYVMDGANHDLDFGTSGVEGNILIVFPTDKKGNCTIYEFTQGAFYDTPECHQYVCHTGHERIEIGIAPHCVTSTPAPKS